MELVRNVPLLLLLLFLAATMHALPPAREALERLPNVFVSDRGLVLPSVGLTVVHWTLGAVVLAVLAVGTRLPRVRRSGGQRSCDEASQHHSMRRCPLPWW